MPRVSGRFKQPSARAYDPALLPDINFEVTESLLQSDSRGDTKVLHNSLGNYGLRDKSPLQDSKRDIDPPLVQNASGDYPKCFRI